MTKPGDIGLLRPVGGERIFVPARRPVVGEKCLLYPILGGGRYAIPLDQVRPGDPTLIEPSSGGRIAVPLFSGCVPPTPLFTFEMIGSQLQIRSAAQGKIEWTDAGVWEFTNEAWRYNHRLGSWQNFEPPVGGTVSWTLDLPGWYNIQYEASGDCGFGWTEYVGAVVLPLDVGPTLILDEIEWGYHQTHPRVSHGRIMWRDFDGTDEYIGLWDFSFREVVLKWPQGMVYGTESISAGEYAHWSTGSVAHFIPLLAYTWSDERTPITLRDITGTGSIRSVCGDSAEEYTPIPERSPNGFEPCAERVAWIEVVGGAVSIWTLRIPYYYDYDPWPDPVQAVTGLGADADSLSTGGDLCSWISDGHVHIARLSTGATLYTSPLQTSISHPRTDGTTVVWSDAGEGVYRWTQGEGAVLIGPGKDPDIQKGVIVYVGFSGGNVAIKRLVNGVTTVMHTTPYDCADPSISDATIAWSQLNMSAGVWQVWYLRG